MQKGRRELRDEGLDMLTIGETFLKNLFLTKSHICLYRQSFMEWIIWKACATKKIVSYQVHTITMHIEF
jgi:hypothetical protein